MKTTEEPNKQSNFEGADIKAAGPLPVTRDDTPVTGSAASPILVHPPEPSDLPPTYENSDPFNSPTTHPMPLQLFVAAHPAWISPELGVKLRNAGYNPVLDPDLMSAERWFDKYGVDEFELVSLREAFKA